LREKGVASSCAYLEQLKTPAFKKSTEERLNGVNVLAKPGCTGLVFVAAQRIHGPNAFVNGGKQPLLNLIRSLGQTAEQVEGES
jgi:hypothetical protein